MKILLISYYWRPYNNSGAFRWLHLSKYIKFDVLTSKKPTEGFFDETMPQFNGKIYRIGKFIPAVFGGLLLSICSWFIRADKYIYTCPPETLLFGAWVNQLLGRKVYVDMRDAIDRHTQPHKWLTELYKWLYARIKNVCVCMKFFDPIKPVIRHGYEDIKKLRKSNLINEMLGLQAYRHDGYCEALANGEGRDYSNAKFSNYNSSSVVNLRHLGNPIKGKENLHPECFKFKPEPWSKIAEQMNEFLSR